MAMKPRNAETDEVIRLLAQKLPVRDVAERLSMTAGEVNTVYVRHYDEIVQAQRDAERRRKAEELSQLMAKPKPEPATEPDHKAAEPDRKATEPDHKAAEPDRKATEPDRKAAEPDHKAAEPDHKAAEPEPAVAAAPEPTSVLKREAAKVRKAPRLPVAPTEAAEAPATGRLRVCGYLGACGRVYIQRGGTIEINNLASRFSKEDLRAFAHEVLEMVRILDGQAVGA